ncbi:MAG: HlyC/CorC family transporter [Chlamydiales bacterium]|nr:HlyC/CorC family transporter [Chlamydiales bacterium]
MSQPMYFLTLIIIALCIQAFFAMMEMACVSFNKIKLQYYVSQNDKKAIWLSKLLSNPSRLFGTTLVGVNTALQFGSECSRRFYESIGLDPDWAPLSQIIIVVIFAELAPMFAARRYAEHVTMLGIRVLYFFSILLRPLQFCFDLLNRLFSKIGKTQITNINYLTREELQNAMEEREDQLGYSEKEEFDTLAANIFSLKNRNSKSLMYPIRDIFMLPAIASVGDMRRAMRIKNRPFIPIFQTTKSNILGIVYPRDLLRAKDEEMLKNHLHSPWFITENNSLPQIIKQFRWNKQNVAIVLNANGIASGILTLDAIVDEIFLESTYTMDDLSNQRVLIDRLFPADTAIKEINEHCHVLIKSKSDNQTLEELMTEILGHHPSRGEIVRTGHYELVVEEAPLIGGKEIHIRSV